MGIECFFCFVGALITGLSTIITFLWLKNRLFPKPPTEPKLNKPDWEKNVVYLCQVRVVPEIRSVSPFALKLESWLRLNKIKYDNVYTNVPSLKGQTPYIEFNGHQIPDTNIIMKTLSEKFALDPDAGTTESERALAHAVKIMVEQHTCQIGFYWRYVLYKGGFAYKINAIDWIPWYIRITFVDGIFPVFNRMKGFFQGIGRHTEEEAIAFANQDLASLSTLLKDKPFFLGDKLTSIDCTLYGNLAQFLYMPGGIPFPQKKFIQENCQNLEQYVDRIRDELWPDWKEMTDPACMKGKFGTPLWFETQP